MIPGSEDQKDASASLYCYLEKPSKVVFYDFSCSLSEYTQNRESGYFSQTRFFHNIFHRYSHKCSSAFRCERLEGFSGFNASICQQFNAFFTVYKGFSQTDDSRTLRFLCAVFYLNLEQAKTRFL